MIGTLSDATKPTYLTRNELAQLVGCAPRSVSVMRKWLEKNGWPFQENRRGFPVVSRSYHDARMSGAKPANDFATEPDFSSFRTAI